MKKLVMILGLLLSVQAVACPDLSGTYQDKNGESLVLAQKGCDEVSVLSRPLTHTLILDNIYTVVQDDNDLTAYGRGIFDNEILVLEAKVTYKKDPGIPKFLLPVRAVSKYTSTTNNDLQEIATIYNWYDKVLTTTKTIYKRSAY
jgi:hypothetical protein